MVKGHEHEMCGLEMGLGLGLGLGLLDCRASL